MKPIDNLGETRWDSCEFSTAREYFGKNWHYCSHKDNLHGLDSNYGVENSCNSEDWRHCPLNKMRCKRDE